MIAILALAGGCASDPAEPFRELGSDLPERWLRALTSSSEQEWERFGRSEGAGYLGRVAVRLMHITRAESDEAFSSTFAIVEPALTRVRRLLAEEYGFDRQWQMYSEFKQLSPDVAARCVREDRQAYAIARDREIEPARRAELIEGIARALERRQVPFSTSQLWIQIAEARGRAGQKNLQLEALQKCVRQSYEEGKFRITCQALGVIGSWYEQERDYGTMMRYFDEGLRVARAHRLPEQTGRLLAFQANYYASRGRLTIARELLKQATEACDEYGGAPTEMRFLIDSLEFNARLGCWDLVAADSRRGEQMIRRLDRWWESSARGGWRARFEDYAGYVDLLHGRVGEGRRRFLRSEATLSELGQLRALARLRMRWARGMKSNGLLSESLSVLQRGVADAADAQTEGLFWSEIAALHADREDWSECEKALQAYAELDRVHWVNPSAGLMLYEVTRVRRVRARGDWDATVEALHEALVRAGERLAQIPATQEGNLILSELHPLHDLVLSMVRGHAEAGMAVELEWRRTPSHLGRAEPYESSAFASIEHIVREARHPEGKGPGLGHGATILVEHSPSTVQIVYRVDEGGTLRWVRSAGGVDEELLAIPDRELTDLVERVLHEVRTRPTGEEDSPPADWVAESAHLAHRLIPLEILEAATESDRPLRILVGPDACLRGLPFEILSVREDRYDPLVQYCDIQYLGHVSKSPDDEAPSGVGSTDGGLVVADPVVNPTYSGWGDGLPRLRFGRSEAQHLHELAPRSHLLVGAECTKSALISRWERAPFLYFAAHVVQDPEAAYLSYLPLSSGGTDRDPKQDRLDLNDLSTVRFEANPTIVLAACSSGADFLVKGAHSPGLGEGFLRAGASTVIQNLWSVEDEAASELMKEFIDLWVGQGVDPTEAIGGVRRRVWESPGGPRRHPYYWGGVVATVRLDARN